MKSILRTSRPPHYSKTSSDGWMRADVMNYSEVRLVYIHPDGTESEITDLNKSQADIEFCTEARDEWLQDLGLPEITKITFTAI